MLHSYYLIPWMWVARHAYRLFKQPRKKSITQKTSVMHWPNGDATMFNIMEWFGWHQANISQFGKSSHEIWLLVVFGRPELGAEYGGCVRTKTMRRGRYSTTVRGPSEPPWAELIWLPCVLIPFKNHQLTVQFRNGQTAEKAISFPKKKQQKNKIIDVMLCNKTTAPATQIDWEMYRRHQWNHRAPVAHQHNNWWNIYGGQWEKIAPNTVREQPPNKTWKIIEYSWRPNNSGRTIHLCFVVVIHFIRQTRTR